MDLSDIEEFAVRLAHLAEEGQFASLRVYAARLHEMTEAFDLERLPEALRSFAQLLAELEQA
jgi:hypothetical protein